MACEQSQQQLHGYFDGELDALSAAAFEKHLESCADCQRVLAAEQALRTSLQNAELYQRAPGSLRQALASEKAKTPVEMPQRLSAAPPA